MHMAVRIINIKTCFNKICLAYFWSGIWENIRDIYNIQCIIFFFNKNNNVPLAPSKFKSYRHSKGFKFHAQCCPVKLPRITD